MLKTRNIETIFIIKTFCFFIQPVYITVCVACMVLVTYLLFDNVYYISFLIFWQPQFVYYKQSINYNIIILLHTITIFFIRCRKIEKFLWNDKICFICRLVGESGVRKHEYMKKIQKIWILQWKCQYNIIIPKHSLNKKTFTKFLKRFLFLCRVEPIVMCKSRSLGIN